MLFDMARYNWFCFLIGKLCLTPQPVLRVHPTLRTKTSTLLAKTPPTIGVGARHVINDAESPISCPRWEILLFLLIFTHYSLFSQFFSFVAIIFLMLERYGRKMQSHLPLLLYFIRSPCSLHRAGARILGALCGFLKRGLKIRMERLTKRVPECKI